MSEKKRIIGATIFMAVVGLIVAGVGWLMTVADIGPLLLLLGGALAIAATLVTIYHLIVL